MELVRNISDAKLMFYDVQELVNSYTIQFLVEFTDNISIRKIEDTINEIVIRNHGSNVFKNNWVVSSDIIYVKELTFDSGLYMFNENFFNETTDFNKHSIELYLLNIKDDINKIGGKLLLSLKDRKELNMYSAKEYNYHIYPEKIRRFVIKKFFNYLRNKNRYFVVAIVSHLGRLSFNSSYKFSIENNHRPLIPFSTVITEYKNKTNIAICSYKNQILKDMEGVE